MTKEYSIDEIIHEAMRIGKEREKIHPKAELTEYAYKKLYRNLATNPSDLVGNTMRAVSFLAGYYTHYAETVKHSCNLLEFIEKEYKLDEIDDDRI